MTWTEVLLAVIALLIFGLGRTVDKHLQNFAVTLEDIKGSLDEIKMSLEEDKL